MTKEPQSVTIWMHSNRIKISNNICSSHKETETSKYYVTCEFSLLIVNCRIIFLFAAIKRTTRGFDAKGNCSARTYEYLTPTFAFAKDYVSHFVLAEILIPWQSIEEGYNLASTENCKKNKENNLNFLISFQLVQIANRFIELQYMYELFQTENDALFFFI